MSYTDQTFLQKLKPYVIQDMKDSKILASLTAAQAFIESNKGNSGLTKSGNNLFGIKGQYNGQYGMYWTTEYYNGVKQRVKAAFRHYPSWAESIADHSAMFNRMNRYKNLRGETDFNKACVNVKKDGYATAPDYTQTLLNCIKKYRLNEWDAEVTGKLIQISDIKSSKTINTPTLKMGDKNDYVLNWQKFLNQNGYFCGLEDGKFGKNTLDAVKSFQLSKGLNPDGIIGPSTWRAIGVAC